MRLLTGTLLEMPDSGDIETVDIREFLPQRVISDTTRKDGTRFKILRCGPDRVVNNHVRLRSKIVDLVHWANKEEMDRSVVECMMDETMNTYYDSRTLGNEGVTTGTEDNAAIAKVVVENISVNKIVRTNIGGRDNIIVRKSSENQQGGGGSKKGDNEAN